MMKYLFSLAPFKLIKLLIILLIPPYVKKPISLSEVEMKAEHIAYRLHFLRTISFPMVTNAKTRDRTNCQKFEPTTGKKQKTQNFFQVAEIFFVDGIKKMPFVMMT